MGVCAFFGARVAKDVEVLEGGEAEQVGQAGELLQLVLTHIEPSKGRHLFHLQRV